MSTNSLAEWVESRLAAAEEDLDPENIGWIGNDARQRARGRVSALREVLEAIAQAERHPYGPLRPDLFAEQWIGKDYLAEEKWQNLRDSGYDETDLRRAGGDR